MSGHAETRRSDLSYSHRQGSYIVLAVLGTAVALLLVLAFAIGVTVGIVGVWVLSLGLAVLLFAAIAFRNLTIRIRSDRLEWSFGPGLFRRSVPIARIRGVEVVRNRWYYGWGIRLTPHGWLYSVSGLTAVEVTLENGTRFRLGTDDPQGLADAIRVARAQNA